MTVTRRSYTAAMNTSGTSASTRALSVPTDTQDGELMLVFSNGPVGSHTISGTGWTLLGSFVDGSSGTQSNLWRKIASSESGVSYTVTFPSSSAVGAALIVFIGAHDILTYDAQTATAVSTLTARRTDAARDALAYNVCCWRDGASNTLSPNQGVEEFDIVAANTGSTIFRGIGATMYGPGVAGVNDIVNAGDGLIGTTFTASGAVDGAVIWQLLIDNPAPDTEPWSDDNGDFAVELELDKVELDALGGISTTFRGDVTGLVSAVTSLGENLPNEGDEKLMDGLASTKWLHFADTTWVQYDFGASVTKTIRRYRLTSANDAPERDPYTWTLKGSNNGTDFTNLDTRESVAFAARGETLEFKVSSPGAYRYYRLDIATNRGPSSATSTQLAEWRLSTHDVWEDVTPYVQEEGKIRITRGLQGASGRHDFTRAYVTFKNTDGRFSTRNQDGAYFGSLQRNTQMRISKAYGTKSLQLQGAVALAGSHMTGDCIRTVLSDDLQITGDIDVRLDLHPESWRDEQMLCGVQTADTDLNDPNASWSFWLDDDGRLNWSHSTGSATVTYQSTKAVPNAGRQAVRITVDVNNGASGSTATFYTAPTIAGPWTQLGQPDTNSGTTSIAYEGGAMCVGHVQGLPFRGIHGRVFHFELYDGIAGSAVSDIDFTSLTNGVHEFEEDGNRWITIHNAQISNRRYRFHGEVAEWPLYWDSTGNWVEVNATGAGVQKRLERGAMESSALYRHHTRGIIPDPGAFERKAEPNAYWACEDGKNTIRVASSLPGKPHMEIYGTPEFESFENFPGAKTLPKMANGKFGGRVTGNVSGYADIRWVMHVPTSITNGSIMMSMYGTGEIRRWVLTYVSADSWRLQGYDENDDGTIFWDTGSFAMDTVGEYMYCQMILDQSGSNVSVTIQAWDPFGASLGLETDTFAGGTVGAIRRININDDSTNKMNEAYFGHIALYDSVDAPDPADVLNGHQYESTAARIKRICDEEDIEYRYVGAMDQSALLGRQDVGAPFGIMSTTAVSDDGYLTDPLDAFGIEYRTNRSLYNQAAHLTLSYSGFELSGELRPTEDDSYITNDFTANRGDAGSARFRRDDGPLSVNAPPDGVGEYAQQQSYSFAHEGQTVQMASWQVHKGTLDEDRYPRVEVALENLRIAADSALIEGILTLDVGHRLDITDTPDFLPAQDIRQIVIGYEEWFDNFQHNLKLNCVPERWFEIAEYDAGWHFDAEDTVLYQDITSTATQLTVVTETGPPLTVDPKAYPFLAKIDGEVLRVMAPGSLINDNSLFDSNTTGWTSNSTMAHSTSVLHPSPLCRGTALITPGGVAAFANIQSSTSEGIPVVVGNEYTGSGWVYNPSGYSACSVFINWRTGAGTLVSTSTGTSTALVAGEWTYLTVTGTAPATAVTGHVGVQETGTPAATDEFYVWNLKTVEAPPFYGNDAGDSFNRADDATTPGSNDRGSVAAWSESVGAWGIQTNRLYLTAAATGLCTRAGALDFEWMEVEVPVWGSGEAFLVFRYTDSSNYYRWGGTVATDAVFVTRNAGVDTTITPDINGDDWVLAAGDKLAVRCQGSVIECYRNGKLAMTISDSTESGTGIGVRTSTTVPRFDEFYFQEQMQEQVITVERGYNGAAAYHKRDAAVALGNPPYRGL